MGGSATLKETSAKASFYNSVILSEANGGRTFPVEVERAESKDLGCIFGAFCIKIASRPAQGGGAALGNEGLVRL
jgi:hypothetical protein